ncbi:MAG: hypothetical protein IJ239_06450 [Eubacterium sp.]|nr:hypothetical protein [Eubacterium sp.]
MKNPKFTLGIRIIAGCYLIYLAYQIISGGLMKGELHSGQWQFWVSLIGSIVFIIVGIIIAYQASSALMTMRKEEKLKIAEEAVEEAVQQQSSSERFRNMKSLADLEAGTLHSAADSAAASAEDESGSDAIAETESGSGVSGSSEEGIE